MNKSMLAAIVVLVLGIGLFAAYKMTRSSSVTYTPPTEQSPTTDYNANTSPAASGSAQPSTVSTVKITSAGFDPAVIKIKVSDSVTWTNSDSVTHNVSSDPHPTHTIYPALNLGNILAGASKSLTFSQAGTYKYHDHLHSTLTGQVVVSP